MTIYSRHNHVCEQEIDRTGVEAGNFNCFLSATGLQNRIPILLQNGARQGSKGLLVFNEQNRFRSAGGRADNTARGTLWDPFGDSRQINFECRTYTRLAVNPNVASALLHDPVNRCKSQARSFSKVFGGEERLKNMRLSLCIHTHTLVGHI